MEDICSLEKDQSHVKTEKAQINHCQGFADLQKRFKWLAQHRWQLLGAHDP